MFGFGIFLTNKQKYDNVHSQQGEIVMKIKLKSQLSDNEINELINDDEYESDNEKNNLNFDKVRIFLEDYDKLSKKELYNMICNFYMVILEEDDYIEYINYKNNSDYNKVISIGTDVICKDIQSEGHGRDFSWWTVSYRRYLNVAVLGELENSDKFYTLEEIKKLIKDGKIYPIYSYYEECDDRLYENRVKNDIDYLVKYEYGRKKGQLSINDEYFDYFIDKILDNTVIIDMFKSVRNFLIDVRSNIERYLDDYYFDENKETKEKLNQVNGLIDKFNEKIAVLDKETDCDIEIISKNPIERVMKYLKSLYNDDESKRYTDITLEWVLSIISSLDYEDNKELCDEIENIIFDLCDPNLCYDMIYSADWIDNKKLINAIIASGDEYVCYDVLTNLNVNKSTRKKLIKVIVDSGSAEVNYNLVAKGGLDFVDVREHGKVVIDSKNVWYNSLFAQLDGADVLAHGEVVMEYGSAYDNNSFCSYVRGADIEKHREVIRIKLLEEEQAEKNNLKKVRKK